VSSPLRAPGEQGISLGKGIGAVRLDMPLAKVKRALGRTSAVSRRVELALGGEYVELQWGSARWTVGFRTSSGVLRVVRVATTVPGRRTRDGLGVGTKAGEIARRFPSASCQTRELGRAFPGTWITVRDPSGAMTAFLIQNTSYGSPPRPPSHRVIEVVVQRQWFSDTEQVPCADDWRSW
jgi:hypothetical protein